MRNIKIIEVRSEIGAGTRGASLSVDAIKIAALDYMSNLFVNFPSEVIADENKMLYEPVTSPYAKRIQGIHTMYERVSKSVAEAIKSGLFPLVIAGDHSTAGATIAGLKIARPKRKLGVIWVDAHADMHSPFTTPSGNMHGMPLAISLAEDNMDNQVHNPDAHTLEYWKKLKSLGGIEPKILPEDIVFVGLRDYEKEEEALIKKLNIKVITVAELRKKGVENVIRQIFQHLANCDDIYVSFDVDSLDSSISRGTGTPVSNGLRVKEAEDLVASFMQHHKICCMEVAEVNPTLDRENMMAEIAFTILQRGVNLLMVN
jgi:arginase